MIPVNFRYYFLVFLLLLQFGCSTIVRPPVRYNPDLKWFETQTAHFRILSSKPAGLERAAAIAEDAHKSLSVYFHDFPKGKTAIIIDDSSEEVFGLAVAFPHNSIYINPTPPAAIDGLFPISYDDWLKAIIIHEYTHIVHLDDVEGAYEPLRKIMGRIILPNAPQPKWIIEGLATFVETDLGTTDRGGGTYSDMILRMASLENQFPTIDKADGTSMWPLGAAPYYFGSRFFKYLQQQYGNEKIKKLLKQYSSAFPYTLQSNSKKVLGRQFSRLWDEWRRAELEKARIFVNNLKGHLTESSRLTRSGFLTVGARLSPDGTRIAYTAATNGKYSSIIIADLTGKKKTELKHIKSYVRNDGISLSWSPTGEQIAFSQTDFSDNYSLHNDLYIYDLKTESITRQSNGEKASTPDFSPDGKMLAFIQHRSGTSRLGILELTTGRIAYPRQAQNNTTLSSPRWSPDGNSILVSGHSNGKTGIYILKLARKKTASLNPDISTIDSIRVDRIVTVIKDSYINLHPEWSQDGREIIFASDRQDSVFNIYSTGLLEHLSAAGATEAGRIEKLTNVKGGALMPNLHTSADNKKILIFSGYNSSGFDIHLAELPDTDNSSRPTGEAGKDITELPTKKTDQSTEIIRSNTSYKSLPPSPEAHPYKMRLKDLLPTFWTPFVGVYNEETQVGIFTGGADYIGRNSYSVFLLTGEQSQTCELTWFYNRFRPEIALSVYDRAIRFNDIQIVTASRILPYWERERGIEASVSYLRKRATNSNRLSFALLRESINPINLPEAIISHGLITETGLTYIHNSTHEYMSGRKAGNNILLKMEKSYKLSSSFDFNRYIMVGSIFADSPLKKNHRFYATTTLGLLTGEVPVQKLFRFVSPIVGSNFAAMDSRNVVLRGYDSNRFRGEKAAMFTFEYGFHLKQVDRGISTYPIFLKQIRLNPFFEFGNLWSNDFGSFSQNLKKTIGAELTFDLTVSYFLPIQAKIGYANGMGASGLSQVYLFFTSGI